ncbi:hypothetical protein B4096_0262 [Heyndrickxia coagulans]|nr:hypothetical protein B4096_0262 [Heyndrickxia coagulans]
MSIEWPYFFAPILFILYNRFFNLAAYLVKKFTLQRERFKPKDQYIAPGR